MHLPILLASSSPYRASLLAILGVEFTQASPDIDEQALAGETPRQLAARLSEQKALALRAAYPRHIIIGSDQVAATSNDIVLGKPHTESNAIAQLKACSGDCVKFYTGLCVSLPSSPDKSNATTHVETGKVYFRNLSSREIVAYVKAEQPLDCAGSFKSEGLGISLFERLDFDDPNALIGLPLISLNKILLEHGINILLNQKTNTTP